MNVAKPSPRTFRPTPDNQRQFAFAEKLRLNVSELLNEVCARHFERAVKLKVRKLTRAVSLNGTRKGHTLSRRTTRR